MQVEKGNNYELIFKEIDNDNTFFYKKTIDYKIDSVVSVIDKDDILFILIKDAGLFPVFIFNKKNKYFKQIFFVEYNENDSNIFTYKNLTLDFTNKLYTRNEKDNRKFLLSTTFNFVILEYGKIYLLGKHLKKEIFINPKQKKFFKYSNVFNLQLKNFCFGYFYVYDLEKETTSTVFIIESKDRLTAKIFILNFDVEVYLMYEILKAMVKKTTKELNKMKLIWEMVNK